MQVWSLANKNNHNNRGGGLGVGGDSGDSGDINGESDSSAVQQHRFWQMGHWWWAGGIGDVGAGSGALVVALVALLGYWGVCGGSVGVGGGSVGVGGGGGCGGDIYGSGCFRGIGGVKGRNYKVK